ncbi:MAG TPA: amino acid racemase [Thermoplasmata archaeon]|nr:amino acid racemase [Thermoplasmata archaeon]
MRTIGVLGGMGPVATLEYVGRILALCQRSHGAVQDHEYPPLLVYSMSLEGSDETGVRSSRVLARELERGVAVLQHGGADVITIPCNTAHEFLPRLRRTATVPILNMVELTAQQAVRRGFHRVGVLASESSLGAGLYAKPLLAQRLSAIEPLASERRELTHAILNIMAGRRLGVDRLAMHRIAERMRRVDGIDGMIVGCTELSAVLPAAEYSVPTIDAMDVLAEAAVHTAYEPDLVASSPGATTHEVHLVATGA